ncbi:MAG TPA: hypothetical protein VFI00_01605 [Kribbella sp.]|nr:hypothetical protein [Kribbella sp.]
MSSTATLPLSRVGDRSPGVADANVVNLIRSINHLVISDTGTKSLAT